MSEQGTTKALSICLALLLGGCDSDPPPETRSFLVDKCWATATPELRSRSVFWYTQWIGKVPV